MDEEVEKEIRTPFESTKGPLWRVTYIPIPNGAAHQSDDKEQSKKFPNQFYLLMTFHQSISDDFTTFRVCHIFLSILNDIIDKRAVSDKEQLAEFCDDRETVELIKQRKQQLEKNPRIEESIASDIRKLTVQRPLMNEVFPISEEECHSTTRHISRTLNSKDTTKLLEFFKEEQLTVNSGFLALANLSLVAMFQKRGRNDKSFLIPSYNAINYRRYWKGNQLRNFGCHFGSICLLTDTPANSAHNFLEYAHDIQTNFSDYLENNRVFDESIYLNFLEGTESKNFDEFFTNPPKHHQIFYSTSNMGNLKKILPGDGKQVQISHVDRCNSFHKTNSCLINSLHTFRGRFIFSVDYNANYITEKVATEYIDTIKHLILDIVKQM